jgi:glycosyltransferase involved in cell wall biosynthesis
MKKILIIHSDEFLTNKNPLGGVFQFDQAKYLSENNFKVDILSAGVLSPKKFFQNNVYVKEEKYKKINIFRKYSKNIYPFRLNIFNNLIARKIASNGLKLFKDYLKKNSKPDLIHAHDLRYGSFIAYEIFKKYQIQYVITEHNSDILEYKYPRSLIKITKEIIENSKNFSTVSRLLAERLKLFFKIKKDIKILHNVLAKEFLIKRKLEVRKSSFTFISVTRFDKNKNIEILIEAFQKISKINNSKLKIIGDGPMYSKIKNKIKKKGLSHRIYLLGNLNRKKIITHLSKANCFVLPSKVETFGVSTIEALSCGLPVILSKNAGSIEIKKKISNVIIYKPNKISILYKEMQKIYYSKKVIDKKNLRMKTILTFGVKNFLKQITQIYKI